MSLEDRLIRSIKEGDKEGIRQMLGNRALFNTMFTKNNYNLTMLVLENGSTETFLFFLGVLRGIKKLIKFTQKNIVLYSHPRFRRIERGELLRVRVRAEEGDRGPRTYR